MKEEKKKGDYESLKRKALEKAATKILKQDQKYLRLKEAGDKYKDIYNRIHTSHVTSKKTLD